MKIAMLEARSSIKSVFDYTNQPLMAGPLLGQIMVEKGHHVECFAPQLAPIDWDYIKEMDIVGITALTLTAENAYELTRKCKNLGKTVVMGGPHVSFLPEEALDMGVDFVARREGHATFPELIQAIEQGMTDYSHILGLSWKDSNGRHIHNPDRPFCTQDEFEKLPIPDIKLIHGYGKLTSVPVLTQWGCPDNCEFCSVIQMCGRKIKHRAVESILTELKQLIGIYGPSVSIFFCADNFFAQKSQAEELLRGIIDRKLVVEGGLQMRVDTVCDKKLEVDDGLLSLMYEAGIKMVYLGLESPNQETLDSYGKRLTIRQIEVGVRALAKKKFHTHGMFVLGGDTDDKTVFKKLVKFARRIKVHTVQFINLMPLPGTPLYYRYEREGRILTKDWNKYNGQFAVTKPRLMSAHELQVGTMRAVAKFYSRPWTAWLIFLSLPQILWLLIRYHRLRLNVLKAGISLLTKKKDILQIVTDRLSPHVQARIIHSIRLPFIRLWAHNQVRMVKAQVRGHTKLLRAC